MKEFVKSGTMSLFPVKGGAAQNTSLYEEHLFVLWEDTMLYRILLPVSYFFRGCFPIINKNKFFTVSYSHKA